MVALPALPWLFGATRLMANATLGRDQGIFQYVAWAVGQGEILYRDVRDVNGPLVALVHLALQALGGAEEAAFRRLDLLFTAATFAFLGATIPSLASSDGRVPLRTRIAWGAAGTVALLAQYLAYGFWDTAQRESFFDWFVAIALGAVVLAGAREPLDRRTRGLLALSGAAATLPVFGKPTYLLFTLAVLAGVALDRQRRARLAAFASGACAAVALVLAFLLACGDIGAYLRITLHDVPAMYRFLWPRPASVILGMPGYAVTSSAAALATVLGVGLVAWRRLPVRALPIALTPTLGLVSMLAQEKGFPYHFHPVTFGTVAMALVLVHAAGGWKARRPWLASTIAALLALGLGARTALLAYSAEARARSEHRTAFVRVDFFPAELRRAATEIAARTSPDDRVQMYGMDPYVLFLARRKSATPYIYAYDLNVDAALHGSYDRGGRKPNERERATISAMRAAHEDDLLARVTRSSPAAFVFVDRSPLMSSRDAVADLRAHSPRLMAFVEAGYAARVDGHLEHDPERKDSGILHVWWRSDLR